MSLQLDAKCGFELVTSISPCSPEVDAEPGRSWAQTPTLCHLWCLIVPQQPPGYKPQSPPHLLPCLVLLSLVKSHTARGFSPHKSSHDSKPACTEIISTGAGEEAWGYNTAFYDQTQKFLTPGPQPCLQGKDKLHGVCAATLGRQFLCPHTRHLPRASAGAGVLLGIAACSSDHH